MADQFVLDRDLVRVVGPESGLYLQGQLSQDILLLADGAAAWSWLLAPNGKVDALVRVTRRAAEEWVLDTDGGWGQAVVARLNRFKLRTKAEVDPLAGTVTRWLGPTVPAGDLVLSPAWPGVEATDVIEIGGTAEKSGDYEPVRIALGIPRMGAELDERTIPAETGLVEHTVSFSKGCYTGQELVARIDSRGGHVPRHLRRLRLEGGGAEAGAELRGPDGQPAGTLTSVARDPEDGDAWVGLGYVKRAVAPDAELAVDSSAGPVLVRQVQ